MAVRKRRAFSLAYKAEVVERIRPSGRSIGAVVQELDLAASACSLPSACDRRCHTAV
jgi:transposase-like protein